MLVWICFVLVCWCVCVLLVCLCVVGVLGVLVCWPLSASLSEWRVRDALVRKMGAN